MAFKIYINTLLLHYAKFHSRIYTVLEQRHYILYCMTCDIKENK